MKQLLFSVSIIVFFGVNAQIQGVQDYKHWHRKDSINFGFKAFIYTDFNPYLKHYWYSEGLNEEGLKLMRTELIRLLRLNREDINKPNFTFLDEEDSNNFDLFNFNLLYKTAYHERHEIGVYWKINDIHPVVDEFWIIALIIDKNGITIYVFSSYDLVLFERFKIPE